MTRAVALISAVKWVVQPAARSGDRARPHHDLGAAGGRSSHDDRHPLESRHASRTRRSRIELDRLPSGSHGRNRPGRAATGDPANRPRRPTSPGRKAQGRQSQGDAKESRKNSTPYAATARRESLVINDIGRLGSVPPGWDTPVSVSNLLKTNAPFVPPGWLRDNLQIRRNGPKSGLRSAHRSPGLFWDS